MAALDFSVSNYESNNPFNCLICKKIFQDPRILQCGHHFCRKCLEDICVKEEGFQVSCPDCFYVTLLLDRRVSDLPKHLLVNEKQNKAINFLDAHQERGKYCDLCKGMKNVATNFCLKCEKNFCAQCDKKHHSLEEIVSGSHRTRELSEYTSKLCLRHPKEVVAMYCLNCIMCVCTQCIMGLHKHHKFLNIKDKAKQDRKQIQQLIHSLDTFESEHQLSRVVNLKLDDLKTMKKDIRKSASTMKCLLKESRQELSLAKQDALAQLNGEINELEKFKSEINAFTAAHGSLLDYAKQLEKLPDSELVATEKDLHIANEIATIENICSEKLGKASVGAMFNKFCSGLRQMIDNCRLTLGPSLFLRKVNTSPQTVNTGGNSLPPKPVEKAITPSIRAIANDVLPAIFGRDWCTSESDITPSTGGSNIMSPIRERNEKLTYSNRFETPMAGRIFMTHLASRPSMNPPIGGVVVQHSARGDVTESPTTGSTMDSPPGDTGMMASSSEHPIDPPISEMPPKPSAIDGVMMESPTTRSAMVSSPGGNGMTSSLSGLRPDPPISVIPAKPSAIGGAMGSPIGGNSMSLAPIGSGMPLLSSGLARGPPTCGSVIAPSSSRTTTRPSTDGGAPAPFFCGSAMKSPSVGFAPKSLTAGCAMLPPLSGIFTNPSGSCNSITQLAGKIAVTSLSSENSNSPLLGGGATTSIAVNVARPQTSTEARTPLGHLKEVLKINIAETICGLLLDQREERVVVRCQDAKGPIKLYNYDGELVSLIARRLKRLSYPGCIALDTTRSLYLAPCETALLLIDKSGTLKGEVKLPAGSNLRGVAYSEGGDLYAVSDIGKHRLFLISADNHQVIAQLGSLGSEPSQFSGPYNVHCACVPGFDHVIIVSDCNNCCLKLFDVRGNHLYTYGRRGRRDRQLSNPWGVAIDGSGRLVVTDDFRVTSYWRENGQEEWRCLVSRGRLGNRPEYVAVDPVRALLALCINDNIVLFKSTS